MTILLTSWSDYWLIWLATTAWQVLQKFTPFQLLAEELLLLLLLLLLLEHPSLSYPHSKWLGGEAISLEHLIRWLTCCFEPYIWNESVAETFSLHLREFKSISGQTLSPKWAHIRGLVYPTEKNKTCNVQNLDFSHHTHTHGTMKVWAA